MRQNVYRLKALADLWTGDANQSSGRTIATGLLGSIRWWFEVLVRGLGGRACDPTVNGIRCPDSRIHDPLKAGHRCVVCELFGCTGWARKFRFEVLDRDGETKVSQIKKNEPFQLRFTELRPVKDEEWTLLDLTLRLIADYGAIGGKTTTRTADYGLIKLEAAHMNQSSHNRSELEQYVRSRHWRRVEHGQFGWASLSTFWFIRDCFLNRKQFKSLLRANRWLAGTPGVSRKVFSFREPRRTFGFVNPDCGLALNEMQQRVKKAWPALVNDEFVTGSTILKQLLGQMGGGQP
jgi:CRISPR-associated protein Cmr1